jgi:hypothetical protein
MNDDSINTNYLFDIVIPVGPNDINVIDNMIKHTKKNIIGYRNIYLVSYDPNIVFEGCITIDENIFPFNTALIDNLINSKERSGWYLQQLIKLYCSFTIKNILSNYLVIDSDTIFIKPTTFFKKNIPLYNFGSEYHQPYFNHMVKLHPSLTKQTSYSGICHHMVFQKDKLSKLFKLVEEKKKNRFWKVFLLLIDKNDIMHSGASEYEIYFNYIQIYHKNEFKIRQLNWQNNDSSIKDNDLVYYSNHWYNR